MDEQPPEGCGMRKRGERGLAKETIELIEVCHKILEEMQPHTVRGVCYQLFNKHHLIPSMKRKETSRISRILVTARERGMIPWEWVVDESRQIERPSQWKDIDSFAKTVEIAYRKDYWTTTGKRLIVMSEKSTIGGILRPVIREYGVSFISVHGFNSATMIYDLAQSTRNHPWDGITYIFYVGDFDPSGMYMSEVDLPKRLMEYGGFAHILRLAVTSQDIDNLQTFEAADKESDPRYDWFWMNHGEKCAEIDAMDPNVLRECVAETIRFHIDSEKWERHKLAEQAEIETIKKVCQRMVA
jgi:hypothetical protein